MEARVARPTSFLVLALARHCDEACRYEAGQLPQAARELIAVYEGQADDRA
ncbi:MAG: hypothetical protein QM778_18590 [Myxococcales bacterium]